MKQLYNLNDVAVGDLLLHKYPSRYYIILVNKVNTGVHGKIIYASANDVFNGKIIEYSKCFSLAYVHEWYKCSSEESKWLMV
jgi:hypothetical protein